MHVRCQESQAQTIGQSGRARAPHRSELCRAVAGAYVTGRMCMLVYPYVRLVLSVSRVNPSWAQGVGESIHPTTYSYNMGSWVAGLAASR